MPIKDYEHFWECDIINLNNPYLIILLFDIKIVVKLFKRLQPGIKSHESRRIPEDVVYKKK